MTPSVRRALTCALLAFALAACSRGERGGNVLPEIAMARGAKPVTIYSNLGKGKKAYRCCIAWTIGGPHSKIGQQWIAAPFAPAADRTATSVRLGLTWSLGKNAGLTVALALDRKGRPGRDVAAAKAPANLPAFNDCCVVQSVRFMTPVPLKKGVRYWIVVRTNAATSGSVDNWQNNVTNAGGDVSSNNGNGWSNTPVGKGLPAFAVTGY